MGVRKIDTVLCDGCGICVNHCPMDVLRLDPESKKVYVKYLRDCQSCFLCEAECPEKAVYCYPCFERRVPTAW